MPPSSNRATHSWTVRRVHVCEVRRVLCRVSREYSAHHHHPVADPGVLLCTHGLRQLPDLLVSLVHGWLVDLVIKKLFCLTALQEAKLFGERDSRSSFTYLQVQSRLLGNCQLPF